MSTRTKKNFWWHLCENFLLQAGWQSGLTWHSHNPPTARSRLMDDSSDDGEDDIQPYRRKVRTPQTKRQKHRRIIDDDEDHEENDVIISSISCSSCAESSDENDEDDKENDTSSDDGGMKGFIVSDDDVMCGEDEDHEGNSEESDSEEEEDDIEEESDDREDSDDNEEEEEEDPTDASFGHTYEEAIRKITRSRYFDSYVEKGRNGETFCFRIRDSQPSQPFGDYQELLQSLEKILGRDAVREDDDHNRHFIAGLKPFVKFKLDTTFSSPFFACLCNQNPEKTGGLKMRYGFKDDKTGIVFLFGGECASKHIGCQQHELKHQYDNRLSYIDEGEDEDEDEEEEEDEDDDEEEEDEDDEVRRKK